MENTEKLKENGMTIFLTTHYPEAMQTAADFMPLGVGIRLMKAASMGDDMGRYLTEVVVLAVITVVCSAIAVKTFRWE